MFHGRALESVTLAELKALPKDENQFLEFKEQVDSAEHLCKAVSAFANAQGGLLVIGFKEENNEIVTYDGFENSDPIEKVRQKWVQYLQRIQPAVALVEMNFLDGEAAGGLVGILRVGASPLAPHWVRNFGSSRRPGGKKASDYGHHFFRRRENQSAAMDYYDVRAAFDGARDLTSNLRSRTRKRFEEYGSDDSEQPPAIVCMMVPPRSLQELLNPDIESALSGRDPKLEYCAPRHVSRSGCHPSHYLSSFNHDGLILHYPLKDHDQRLLHIQHFHNGSIEFSISVSDFRKATRSDHIHLNFWKEIFFYMEHFSSLILNHSGSESFFFACALRLVKGLGSAAQLYRDTEETYSKDTYFFPEYFVRSADTAEDDLEVLKTLVAHTLGTYQSHLT